ncbi:MAG: fructose-bisphosphate aldolase class I [Verrucomicrobia bacterium]|nr:fructose-bisphosphate aldolase class I [Verrucomicrobiota bacterium]
MPNSSSPLDATAQALVAPGKGILAADESFPTIEKRFKPLDIPANEESRRAYRETLFTTAGLGEFISGAILFDETLRQTAHAGTRLVEILQKQGILPGIKVDHGTAGLPNFPDEKMTEGLDGLRERLREYHGLGARFTKWRAVLTVSEVLPSLTCIEVNAYRLALFASLSQEAGLVPIVEPEILMDGDHTLARCEEVASITLRTVFAALSAHRVRLEAMLLKPAMVLPGVDCQQSATEEEIATHTVRCLRRTVPAAVPGIVFLSGGQSPTQATQRLTAINRAAAGPWALSFSFGRALQESSLSTWHGKAENIPAAQTALLYSARQNSAAVKARSV